VNRFVFLYEKTGACGIALIVLAQVSLYLFFKNSLYLRWVYRDFKLFFKQVESGDMPITSGKMPSTNPLIGIIQGVADSHATHSRDCVPRLPTCFTNIFSGLPED